MPTVPETIPESEPVTAPPTAERETALLLYDKARRAIGEDVTPGDEIPDEVACVASLQEIIFRTRGRYVGRGAALYNTDAFYLAALTDNQLRITHEPKPGTIAVCRSGHSRKNPSFKGHCAVWGKTHVMSNNSFGGVRGLWTANYTHEGWRDYFEKQRGFTTYYFDLV